MRAPFPRVSMVLLAAAFTVAASLTVAACGSDAAAPTTGAQAATGSSTQGTAGSATTVTSLAGAASTTETSAAATTTSSTTTASEAAAGAGLELFDSSKIHTISVTFVQADYDAMIATYKTTQAKDWIEATVTIDGTTYQNVGMRLKGNSSLRGLANGRGKGTGGVLSVDDPQGLPWLIRLDRNVDGQNYDGITDIVIRSNNSKTSLNEAVSLKLLDLAGLESERAVAVRLAVNGGTAALRLATENPDETWMTEHFSAGGALYKAEASGDYSYRGTDPEAYTDVFDQEAGKDNTDLTPLLKFLDFVNNSDDATFSSTLADRLDVDSFATYLAMEQLIGNFDDIDGPGNNSYLYYDAATGRFTVVPWDHNLAFGGMGGGNPGGNAGNTQGGARGPRGKTNLLVTRFHANAECEVLYQKRLAELQTQLYGSGAAADVLAKWVDVLKTQASDLVNSATIDTEAAKISAYFKAG
jgi:spore coat protein CotH